MLEVRNHKWKEADDFSIMVQVQKMRNSGLVLNKVDPKKTSHNALLLNISEPTSNSSAMMFNIDFLITT